MVAREKDAAGLPLTHHRRHQSVRDGPR